VGPLDLVELTPLMERTTGRPEIVVGLLDGPVDVRHPDLVAASIRQASPSSGAACVRIDSIVCMHGTFVAGVLCARRGSAAPAICPGCTLVVRPIFREPPPDDVELPRTTPEDVAGAIVETVDAGARVLNLSAAFAATRSVGDRALQDALNYAGRRGAIVVAATGNDATLGGSAITRHPCVIPVGACDRNGRPLSLSNFGTSTGRSGLCAPGDEITSIAPQGATIRSRGTSVAAPFVTGAVALLWSEFPSASAAQVRTAVARVPSRARRTVVPPLLDAWAAYRSMEAARVPAADRA
jgi:subtilisin family serine protease